MAIDLEKIQDSPHLLDILLQMEDVLDSLDIYVFKNWFLGEVVEGPRVRRYWLDFTLRYAYRDMPDPRAGLRLLKHGIRVDYRKAQQDSGAPKVTEDSDEDETASEDNLIWLVKVSMPRRLVGQIANTEMDFYDEEIEQEDVEDAKDSGIDDESAYEDPDEDQTEGGTDDELGDEEENADDDEQN